MNQNQPALLWHEHRQRYYCKYTCYDESGQLRPKWVYFSADKEASQRAYDQEMLQWREHRTARNEEIRNQPRTRRQRKLLGDVIKEFYQAREIQGRSVYTLAHLRNSLRRFAAIYAEWDATAFAVGNLQDFKAYLVKLKPKLSAKTIDHELAAAKAVLRWGAHMGYIRPIMLDVVELLPVPRPRPKGYALADAKRMHQLAPDHLKPWIQLTWLTLCRPTETIRLIQGLGDWVDDDGDAAVPRGVVRDRYRVFKLAWGHSKTPNRFIVFSRRALSALDQAEPRYSRTDSFSTACARIEDESGEPAGYRPHFLRHGAATYLHKIAGVDRATVDLALGHVLSRVSETYQPIDFAVLRQTVDRIPSL